jgi:hypothetical protein
LEDDAIDDVGGPKSMLYEWDVYVQKSYPIFSDEGTIVTADVSDGVIETIPEAEDLYGYGDDNTIDIDPVVEVTGDSFDDDFSIEVVNEVLIAKEVVRQIETGQLAEEEVAQYEADEGAVPPTIVAVIPEVESISVTGTSRIGFPFSI